MNKIKEASHSPFCILRQPVGPISRHSMRVSNDALQSFDNVSSRTRSSWRSTQRQIRCWYQRTEKTRRPSNPEILALGFNWASAAVSAELAAAEEATASLTTDGVG